MKSIFLSCLIGSYLFLVTIALSAPPSKPQFEYIVNPSIMYVDSEGSLSICMVNYGGSGDLLHGDQTVVSVPLGASRADLVSTFGIGCESQNPAWIGEVDEISTPGEILLTFRPNGTYTVDIGELICFNLNSLYINSEIGLSVLNIDQQMSGSAQLPIYTEIGVVKMTEDMATSVELDPTVDESVKDGVSFGELSGTASDSQVPNTITVNQAANADTVDGIHASALEESVEIDSDIAAHASLADVHHSKTTSFSELIDSADDAQIPDDITVNKAKDADTLNGVSADLLEESAEINTAFAEHVEIYHPPGQPASLKPVYQFSNPTMGTYLLTISEDEKNIYLDRYQDDVWKYDGVKFCAYSSQEEGTVPVYRFCSEPSGCTAHFYTKSDVEKNNLISDDDYGWKYEKIEWYAYPSPEGGSIPIYRLFNATLGTHFYTTLEEEKDQLVASGQWNYEGIAWYAFWCLKYLL